MIVTFTVKAKYEDLMRMPWDEFKAHEAELSGQMLPGDFADMIQSAEEIVSITNVNIED